MSHTENTCCQTVDILVATYNGEKYVRAQLLSLLYQSYANIRVIVHDDGSTDATQEIVREIAAKDNRVLFIEDGVRCGGPGNNFMHLLRFSNANAVMFCDQDDIWFDNKVSEMLRILKMQEASIPQVVYSEVYVWHPTSGIDGFVLPHPIELRDFLFLNGGIHGCAAMFNANMRVLMLRWHGYVQMHDHILALLAFTLGKVTYMKTPLMLYRRHLEAVTGRFSTHSTWKTAIFKNRVFPVVAEETYRAVQTFLNVYAKELDGRTQSFIKAYLHMKDENFIQRARSVILNRFKIKNSTIRLLVKLMLRPYIKKITFCRAD